MTAPIRAVVIDDEPHARDHLKALLSAHSDVVVTRECVDGQAAVETLRSTWVDLVFLDVQMPKLDGFGVVASIGAERMPPVIFTSAYSEFAVRAFEAYALDYLLKPFDDTRLAAAMDRARAEIGARQRGAPAPSDSRIDPRLVGLLEHLSQEPRGQFPDSIAIKSGTQYVVTRLADVDWIEADGNYAKLWVQRRPRLLGKPLAVLEKDVLDPHVFVRVHRSAIVNTTKITAVEPVQHGDLVLILHDGTRVQCSRRYRQRLDERMYFTT